MASRPRLLLLTAVTALALLTPPAVAGAAVRTGPAGTAFYTPPSPLPGARHGDPIWVRPQSPANAMRLAGASRNLLVLHRSVGVSGRGVAVSGSIALPQGRPPRGGFPVLTWAHGTTGIADRCAPTRLRRSNDSYNRAVRAQLQRYLRAGYAVVATDYEGLGTPGGHPFLVGASGGRSVLDVVRAARRVDPRIGRRVAIMGHSQGGHAALWAAALARSYTPELQVRGTVAYAPASHIAEQAGALDLLTSPSSLSAFAAMILRGAELVQPSLRVRELLTEQAAALYPSVDERCFGELAQPSSYGGLAPAAVVRPGADRTAALAVIAPSDPEDLTIRTPVWIGQGTADATVLPPFTDQLEAKLRARGTPVTSRRWEGVDHDRIVRRGQAAARSFLRRRVGR